MGIFVALVGIGLIMFFQQFMMAFVVPAAVPAALYLWIASKIFDTWVGTKLFFIHVLVAFVLFGVTFYWIFVNSEFYKKVL